MYLPCPRIGDTSLCGQSESGCAPLLHLHGAVHWRQQPSITHSAGPCRRLRGAGRAYSLAYEKSRLAWRGSACPLRPLIAQSVAVGSPPSNAALHYPGCAAAWLPSGTAGGQRRGQVHKQSAARLQTFAERVGSVRRFGSASVRVPPRPTRWCLRTDTWGLGVLSPGSGVRTRPRAMSAVKRRTRTVLPPALCFIRPSALAPSLAPCFPGVCPCRGGEGGVDGVGPISRSAGPAAREASAGALEA